LVGVGVVFMVELLVCILFGVFILKVYFDNYVVVCFYEWLGFVE